MSGKYMWLAIGLVAGTLFGSKAVAAVRGRLG